MLIPHKVKLDDAKLASNMPGLLFIFKEIPI